MDKGTASATGFTYDERYVDYLMNKPERLDWKSGLIHSHNNMGVFFSGTDEKELATNAKAHNYYLSVVVNNRLDIIGKIGFIGEMEVPVKAPYYALDENGKKYLIENVSFTHKKEKLFTYGCNISYKIPENNLDKEFMENVTKIMEAKKVVAPDFGRHYDTGWVSPIEDYYQNRAYPQREVYNPSHPFIKPVVDNQRGIPVKGNPFQSFEQAVEESQEDLRIKQFILICLGYNKASVKDLDFEDCLEEMQISINKKEFDSGFLEDMFFENLVMNFDEFFPPEYVEADWADEEINLTLNKYSTKYPFLSNIYNTINNELQ